MPVCTPGWVGGLAWYQSGKGVPSGHTLGVGGPIGWVPSGKGVPSGNMKRVAGSPLGQGYIYWHLRDNNCQEKNIAKGKLRKNLLLILRTFLHESVKTSAIHYKSVLSNHPTVIVYCGDRSTVVLDQNMASH